MLPATAAQPEVAGRRRPGAAGAARSRCSLDGMLVEVGGSHRRRARAAARHRPPRSCSSGPTWRCTPPRAPRGGLRVYEVDLDTDDPRRLALVGRARARRCADGGLQVHLQPIARAGHRRRPRASRRWCAGSTPSSARCTRTSCVPVAERSGLIGAADQRTSSTGAWPPCAAWRAEGLELGVAVNLSTRSLVDLAFVGEVRRLLAAARRARPACSPSRSPRASSWPTRERAVGAARRACGRSACASRSTTSAPATPRWPTSPGCPVDEIKIDQSLRAAALRTGRDDVAVVRSVVELGRGLGLDVVAEGVEDARDLAGAARRWAARTARAGTSARPMPPPSCAGWLHERAERVRVPVRPAPLPRAAAAARRGRAGAVAVGVRGQLRADRGLRLRGRRPDRRPRRCSTSCPARSCCTSATPRTGRTGRCRSPRSAGTRSPSATGSSTRA